LNCLFFHCFFDLLLLLVLAGSTIVVDKESVLATVLLSDVLQHVNVEGGVEGDVGNQLQRLLAHHGLLKRSRSVSGRALADGQQGNTLRFGFGRIPEKTGGFQKY
jgi:hypothetical protein